VNKRLDVATLTAPAPSAPPEVILQPGEYFVGGGMRVRTLLGSCVSITLWHPRRRIGAMSHFVLADRGGARRGTPDARYGNEALALMMAELALLKVAPEECEGKIFGGGDMFPEQASRMAGMAGVGRRNGEAAWALLEASGVKVVSQHLYGDGHRQIIFDLDTGHVWVRHVKPGAAAFVEPGRKR
jgi:chemotaxis protein CheD